MRSEVAQDWTWADEHIDAVINVLKQNAMHLLVIRPASQKADQEEATDLVISVIGGDVAVRVRRPKYGLRYRDFTLRAYRKNGTKTELAKINEGFARWYLYAWSDGKGGLADWILVDLEKLRASSLLEKPDEIKDNWDGQTGFYAWHTETLWTNGCLVSTANIMEFQQVRMAL